MKSELVKEGDIKLKERKGFQQPQTHYSQKKNWNENFEQLFL